MFRGICGVCGKELEEDYRNQHGKEKTVKKYRLKNPNMAGVFIDSRTILERVGDGWPIDLGLVEEIPDEPKRVYMDRYEALRMVYEHDKKVAYDSEEWGVRYKFIWYASKYDMGLYTKTDSLGGALSKTYDQKLWYVVEEN